MRGEGGWKNKWQVARRSGREDAVAALLQLLHACCMLEVARRSGRGWLTKVEHVMKQNQLENLSWLSRGRPLSTPTAPCRRRQLSHVQALGSLV